MRKETALVGGARAVTIVSPSWAAELERRFRPGTKLHVLTNGYDPEEFANVTPYKFDHFAIVYAGVFYRPKRVISPIMAALQQLKRNPNGEGPKWLFHYYGSQGEHVREEARRYGVSDAVVLHGHVPRSMVLSAVRGAGMAVTISSVSEDAQFAERGIVPAKLFESLGLGTPTLLIAPPGADAEAILETTRMGHRFSGRDTCGIARFLNEAIHGKGPQPGNSGLYAWANIGLQLDRILREALSSGHRSRSLVQSVCNR
jgi:glycosyltransferase involved in cell wall biosynthesis